MKYNWIKNIFQENPPYNKGAFRIEVNFPAEYPFKPPKVTSRVKSITLMWMKRDRSVNEYF